MFYSHVFIAPLVVSGIISTFFVFSECASSDCVYMLHLFYQNQVTVCLIATHPLKAGIWAGISLLKE